MTGMGTGQLATLSRARMRPRVATVFEETNSRTFLSTLLTFFQSYSTAVFST